MSDTLSLDPLADDQKLLTQVADPCALSVNSIIEFGDEDIVDGVAMYRTSQPYCPAHFDHSCRMSA